METGMCRRESRNYLFNGQQKEVLTRRSFELASKVHSSSYSAVIFLDNTGRILGEGFQVLYQKLYFADPPEVGFINIGNEKVAHVANQSIAGVKPRDMDAAREYINSLQNENDLKNAFGIENIDQLKRYLNSFPPGNKLIVDDLTITQTSKHLSLKSAELLDPDSDYSYFLLLEDEKDRWSFITEDGDTRLPWSNRWTLREDDPDNLGSFFSREQQDSELNYAYRLRDDYLRLLSEAADKNYSPEKKSSIVKRYSRLVSLVRSIGAGK